VAWRGEPKASRADLEIEPSGSMKMSRSRATTESPQVDELDATDVQVAPPWMTVLHNCDCHTFEEVVKQLMKAIACSEERGWELAWQVHNTGKAVVKVGSETECVRVGNVLASIGLVVTVTQS
jgi:ATP-dependent Clp protease adaptor protein ClpS